MTKPLIQFEGVKNNICNRSICNAKSEHMHSQNKFWYCGDCASFIDRCNKEHNLFPSLKETT